MSQNGCVRSLTNTLFIEKEVKLGEIKKEINNYF